MMMDTYTHMSKVLDYKGLSKLRCVSKEVRETVTEDFIAKSRPHALIALAYIGREIINHRINTPANPFVFHSQDEHGMHFVNNEDPIQFITLIDVYVVQSTVTTNTVYIQIKNRRCHLTGCIIVTLTPSHSNPMHSGTVQIFHDQKDTIFADYTNFLQVIEWCPVQRP
jgi:hypothetical protein